MTAPQFPVLRPQIVLGIAAHPDDLDFMAAGTMAKFAADGADVYYLILTDGGSGSNDRNMTPAKLKQQRHHEQQTAAKVLGLKQVFFADYHDGTLQCSQDVKKDIVRYIRRLKPDVVVSIDPSVLYSPANGFINHPDHRAAGQATLDAVFPLARDHLSFPELVDEGYEPHETATILLFNLENSNFAVDVSDTLSLKFKALAEHASQVPDLETVKRRFTEIATRHGEAYGCKYAESFVRIDIR